ncbi:hypothetical protein JL720_8181 [Aureococcus anophagefferens]|nr:hypothetical protein JL720_8181 [Aureococcus anophagefferens]
MALRRLLTLVALGGSASGFLVAPARPRARPLRAAEADNDDAAAPLSDDDAAAARASLERLMLAGAADGAERPVERSEPVAMSGTAKRRRAEERAHIEALGRARDPEAFGAAVTSLWSLWFSERGAKNKEALEEIDLMIGSGEACWEDASQAAAELVEVHPDWPEPLNRLATLKYLTGDFAESRHLHVPRELGTTPPSPTGALPTDDDERARWAARALKAFDRQASNYGA